MLGKYATPSPPTSTDCGGWKAGAEVLKLDGRRPSGLVGNFFPVGVRISTRELMRGGAKMGWPVVGSIKPLTGGEGAVG